MFHRWRHMNLTLFQALKPSLYASDAWLYEPQTRSRNHAIISTYRYKRHKTSLKKLTGMLQSIMRKNHHNLWKWVFMFTEVNCSGLKDSRFNEQLLLAALKMFVRETQRERERRSTDNTRRMWSHQGDVISRNHEKLIFPQHLFFEN